MAYFDSVEFCKEECCNCHMIFMITKAFHDAMRATGAYFHCPTGHAQHYTKSDLQKKQEALDLSQRQLEQERREAASLRENMVAAQRAQKKAEGKIEAMKKRSAAGVCPCCNRTFSQLADHMETQHKEFRQLAGVGPKKELTAGA